MNDDAELYHKSNNLQKLDAMRCLEDYGAMMKWMGSGDRTIDIGCGDGYVTNIIKEYMPHNFAKLVGCDINESMVKFANNHFGNERTSFTQLDIEANLPDDLTNSFDHVFSFFALHWIQNQEKAFRNIYNLLSDKGDCLISLVGHTPLSNIYTVLSQTEKWSTWLKGFERFISPYNNIDEPEKHIMQMLKKIGFKHCDVRCTQKQYKYQSVQQLKDATSAVNPFKMPKDIFNDFFEDYMDVVRDLKLFNLTNSSDTVTVYYDSIVVYASK